MTQTIVFDERRQSPSNRKGGRVCQVPQEPLGMTQTVSGLTTIPKPPKSRLVTRTIPTTVTEHWRVEECTDELERSEHVEYEKEKLRKLLCGDCGETLMPLIASDAPKIQWFCENEDCVACYRRTGLVLAEENFHPAKARQDEKNIEGLGNAPTKMSMWDHGLGSHGWQSTMVQKTTEAHNTFNISTRPGRLHMGKEKQGLKQKISTNQDDPRLHFARELFQRHKKRLVLNWTEDRWEHHTSAFCALLRKHMDTRNPNPPYAMIRDAINAYFIHVGVPPLLPDAEDQKQEVLGLI